MSKEVVQTQRLILRPWQKTDLEPFAKLNADLRVMEYFPSVLSPKESDDLAKRIISKIEEQGWGLWAVSVTGIADFIGFIGLSKPSFEAHFTPAVEVGWRLAFDHWGKGYATEGAKAALAYGFETINLPEIVSFTAGGNIRSRGVMEKLGMTYSPADDFNHPHLNERHPHRRLVLYRLEKNDWQVNQLK